MRARNWKSIVSNLIVIFLSCKSINLIDFDVIVGAKMHKAMLIFYHIRLHTLKTHAGIQPNSACITDLPLMLQRDELRKRCEIQFSNQQYQPNA